MSTSSVETYKEFAELYDLYVGSYADDLEFYKSFCNKNDKIIEIGCGTGRVLKYLLDNGYSTHGVDVSDEMLAKAKQKLNKYINAGMLKLFNHDYTYIPTELFYNKALVTFYTFNYVIEKPEDFLKNIYKSLELDGMLVMDLFYPKTLADKSLNNKWTEQSLNVNGKNIAIKDKRIVETNIEHRTQIYEIDGREIVIETRRKYYSPTYMTKILSKIGFVDIEFSFDFANKYFSKTINTNDLLQNFVVKAKK